MKPFLNNVKSRVEAHFLENVRARLGWTSEICEDFEYVMGAGGKSVRPAMLFLFYQSLSKNQNAWPEFVLDAALSLEMIHSYSLVHDDLPCMDDDDFRRGRLSLHRYKNEERAVLVGDALLTGAFEVLSTSHVSSCLTKHLVCELARASGARGMIHGQCMDIGRDQSVFKEREKLDKLHDLKTGALFGAAASMGAICAAESDVGVLQRIDFFRNWGVLLGRLFQIVDDLHDEGPYLELLGKKGLRAECLKISDKLYQEMKPSFGAESKKLENMLEFFVNRIA